jgi:hypothetical protein
MSMQLARKAIKLFSNPENTRSQNRHLQRQWMRSMSFLDRDKHILTKPMPVNKSYYDSHVLK